MIKKNYKKSWILVGLLILTGFFLTACDEKEEESSTEDKTIDVSAPVQKTKESFYKLGEKFDESKKDYGVLFEKDDFTDETDKIRNEENYGIEFNEMVYTYFTSIGKVSYHTTNNIVCKIVVDPSTKNGRHVGYPETTEEKDKYKKFFMPEDAVLEYEQERPHDNVPEFGEVFTSQSIEQNKDIYPSYNENKKNPAHFVVAAQLNTHDENKMILYYVSLQTYYWEQTNY